MNCGFSLLFLLSEACSERRGFSLNFAFFRVSVGDWTERVSEGRLSLA